MTRAAIYARFSTENQREASIEDQVRGCERHAVTLGVILVSHFEDKAISAGTTERPGYQRMLEAARAGAFDLLIVEDISRLWRNRAEYGARSAELEDLGIHLVTCVGDDTRRDGWGLVLGIKHAIAEHQRREISYRTRRGLEGRALAGAPTGGRTFGYASGAPDPAQVPTVQRIFTRAAAGASAAVIASELDAAGGRAPRGGRWAASTVNVILRNPRYTGALIWGSTECRGSATDSARKTRRRRQEPLVSRRDETLRIVTDELWQAARSGAEKRLHRATVRV